MNRLNNMLGLANRAGKLVSGAQAVDIAFKKGCFLAAAEEDTAENTLEKLKQACQKQNVPLILLPEGEIGSAIGKHGRKLCAVTDAGFAAKIQELYALQKSGC